MKKSIFQITIALLVILGASFALSSFKSKTNVKTLNSSDIEVQYCNGQKFYVLRDGNNGYNVAFIKAN